MADHLGEANNSDQNGGRSVRSQFTHFDDRENPQMVDVSGKGESFRVATASGIIAMTLEAADAVRKGAIKKGNVIQVAIIAGIQAAKKTSELIPLCHPIPLSKIQISEDWRSSTELQFTATVRSMGRTGVEMEALAAVSIAALTVYDMCKSIDKTMVIRDVMLQFKSGGKSGDYSRAMIENESH